MRNPGKEEFFACLSNKVSPFSRLFKGGKSKFAKEDSNCRPAGDHLFPVRCTIELKSGTIAARRRNEM